MRRLRAIAVSLFVLLFMSIILVGVFVRADQKAARPELSSKFQDNRPPTKKAAPKKPSKQRHANKQGDDRTSQEDPWIETDMPYKVVPGQPFKMDVWIDGLPENDHKVRKVYMEQTDAIQYSPRVLYIRPGQRSTTVAKVLRTTAGLAVIELNSEGFETYTTTLDAGFKAK